MYLVIETCDRTLSSVQPAADRTDAVRIANEHLEHHVCDVLDRPEVWNEYTGPNVLPHDGALDMQIADPPDGSVDAWSNLCGQNYDAFTHYVSPETERQLLTLLLKGMCQRRTNENDPKCGDGACGECPIHQILEQIQAAPPESAEIEGMAYGEHE